MSTSTLNRCGTGLLLAGGLGLILLMGYTLSLEVGGLGGPDRLARDGVAEVAVFFPDRGDWDDFREALRASARRGRAEVTREEVDSVLIRTAGGREARFTWHGVWGARPTEDEVRRIVGPETMPSAVVGSVNTVLTVALADALRRATEDDTGSVDDPDPGPKPVLLVPWASSVMVEIPGRGPGPVRLLDIYPGRTFRFCADNQGEADLMVDWLTRLEPEATPGRAVIVVERSDPYSRDLADCFRRAIAAAAPRADLVEQADAVAPVSPGPASLPGQPDAVGPEERRWAEATWKAALDDPEGRPTWVVLPLQSEPSIRLLAALRERAPRLPAGKVPIRVLGGDGIGVEALAGLAGDVPFPIASVSSSSAPRAGREPGEEANDVQTLSEIAAALLLAMDRPGPGGDLRGPLEAIDLAADDPSAFGRSLAFDPSGHRRGGDELGHVLAVRPGSSEIQAFARGPEGRWRSPVSVRPTLAAGRR